MLRKILCGLALSAGITVAVGSPGGATPVATGCPSAYERKLVSEWATMGYDFVPPIVDAEGNNDGYVCGHALPEGFTFGRIRTAIGIEPTVDVLYQFADNDSPAQKP